MRIVSAAFYPAEVVHDRCAPLLESARRHGLSVDLHGIGQTFRSMLDAKATALLTVLERSAGDGDDEVICVCDSSDTLINDGGAALVRAAGRLSDTCRVIVSAETNCYPMAELKVFYDGLPYDRCEPFRYVNAGFVLGTRGALVRCLRRIGELAATRRLPYTDDDQFWWTYLFLFEDWGIRLDDRLTCLNLHGVDLDTLEVTDHVRYGGERPFLVHFNGPVKSRIEEFHLRTTAPDPAADLIKVTKRVGGASVNLLARFGRFDTWIIDHVARTYGALPFAAHVIDVGGHCGYFSTLYKTRHPTSHVEMYEPYEPNLRIAERNFALNGVAVATFPGAVTGSAACGYVHVLEGHNLGRIVCDDRPSPIPVSACYDINAILAGKTDVLLKIDAEGAEWDILPAITAENWAGITEVAGEWHSTAKGGTWDDFRPLLRDLTVVARAGNTFRARRA